MVEGHQKKADSDSKLTEQLINTCDKNDKFLKNLESQLKVNQDVLSLISNNYVCKTRTQELFDAFDTLQEYQKEHPDVNGRLERME